MLIGITGLAQHGKDTVGGMLVKDWHFSRFAFADQLKELALRVNPLIGWEHRLAEEVADVGWEAAKKNPEVRRFLQDLGTSARDIIGPDAWIEALDRLRVNTSMDNHVITDVRFPNEEEYIHRWSGKLIRVTRYDPYDVDDYVLFDNGLGTAHESERYVQTLRADYELTNYSGFTAQLRQDLGNIMLKAVTDWSHTA